MIAEVVCSTVLLGHCILQTKLMKEPLAAMVVITMMILDMMQSCFLWDLEQASCLPLQRHYHLRIYQNTR